MRWRVLVPTGTACPHQQAAPSHLRWGAVQVVHLHLPLEGPLPLACDPCETASSGSPGPILQVEASLLLGHHLCPPEARGCGWQVKAEETLCRHQRGARPGLYRMARLAAATPHLRGGRLGRNPRGWSGDSSQSSCCVWGATGFTGGSYAKFPGLNCGVLSPYRTSTLCATDQPGQFLGAVPSVWTPEWRGGGVSRDDAFSPARRFRGASYLASSRHSRAGSTGVGSTLTTPGSWTRFGFPRCHGTRSPGGGVGHYGPSPKSFSTACPEEAADGPDQEGPHEAPQRAWCAHAPLRAPTAQPCAEVQSCSPGGAAVPKHHSSPHGQVRAAPSTGVVHPLGHQSSPQVPAPEIPTPVRRSVDLCGNCCVSGWIAIWLVWGMDWILYELQDFISL